MIARRGFLRGILAAGMAPAIVKTEILMPVRRIAVPSQDLTLTGMWLRLQQAEHRLLLERAGIASCPPLIVSEMGSIDRFTFLSSPLLPRERPRGWRL